jgi:hypothetical protein
MCGEGFGQAHGSAAYTRGVHLSPTIFRQGPYRFFFFSKEEPRMHVHVHSPHGEAKFWMEAKIELANNYDLNSREVQSVQRLIEEHANEIREAWKAHFGG